MTSAAAASEGASEKESSGFDDPFKMIRNNFNFTFVCEFLHKFSSAFFNGPDDSLPTTPFMEHLLLYQDDAKKLNTFFIKLLKPLPGWRMINHENWFESLAKEYKKRDLEANFVSDVPATSSTILTIPLLQRLEILRNLCEFHLEQPEHFWELLRTKDGEAEWRVEPIGRDSLNRRYWIFSDARLYREIEGFEEQQKQTRKKSNRKQQPVDDDSSLPWDIEDESNWELVCLTRADYDEFLASGLPAPLKPKDKAFLKMIREEFIPQVEPVLSYQLSQHKKYFRPVAAERTFLMPRKRSSRLLEKELEEEQRRAEEQAAEKERKRLMQEQLANSITSSSYSNNTYVKSREEIEKDLAAERELRAEMRRAKKEKEMQIKAIEEAFYSTYDPDEERAITNDEVDIISEDEKEIPKSPIKLVLKMSVKPVIADTADTTTSADTDSIDANVEITDTTTIDVIDTEVPIVTPIITPFVTTEDTNNDTNNTILHNSDSIEVVDVQAEDQQPVVVDDKPLESNIDTTVAEDTITITSQCDSEDARLLLEMKHNITNKNNNN